MSSLPERVGLAAALLLVAAAMAGCGFHPAARQALPETDQPVCVDSGQPYGPLENMLRSAFAQSDASVVLDCTKARGLVRILVEDHTRQALAIDANGRPTEYAMHYVVRFRMTDKAGHDLMPAQTLRLVRAYAYSIQVELGTSRLESDILTQLRQEATRLIMLRISAADRARPVSPPAAGT